MRRERIIAHLRELETALSDWKRYRKFTFKELTSNRDVQNMVLHALLVSIQAAIDIANQIIVSKTNKRPSTYRECFKILVEEKIVEEELGDALADLAGFRNIIVHTYWNVNLKEVYNVLQNDLKTVEKFCEEIKNLLKSSKN
ncbi:MAG: type VII toxin-antitoxin system HepT family RNase toxin [Candidatus Odinarchaeia archaeon]